MQIKSGVCHYIIAFDGDYYCRSSINHTEVFKLIIAALIVMPL